MRNLYPNVMKIIINSIIEPGVFRNKLMKIRSKVITRANFISVEIEDFIDYCKSIKQNQKDFSLKSIYTHMNYNEGETEK